MSRTAPPSPPAAGLFGLTPASIALVALVGGAMAMAISPVFVRVADVGPMASAFWRVTLALPLLLVWALGEGGRAVLAGAFRSRATWAAGAFFSADLVCWHLAIMKTSIANATFLATMAPLWVVIGSWIFIGERVERRVMGGLVLCIIGGAILLGGSYALEPEKLVGDLYGIGTSVFFGAYFLAVRVARRSVPSGAVTFVSSVITSLVLLTVALSVEPRLLPASLEGAAALMGLSFISHAGGQGLLAFALGHLSAAFSSLVIFFEAVAAAIFAWILLGEPLGIAQVAGGVMILAGIFVARPRS